MIIDNKKVVIKVAYDVAGWLGYLYDQHHILNFNYGTYKKTTIFHRTREALRNEVTIFIDDIKKLSQILIPPIFVSFYFTNIKFRRGVYEFYTLK